MFFVVTISVTLSTTVKPDVAFVLRSIKIVVASALLFCHCKLTDVSVAFIACKLVGADNELSAFASVGVRFSFEQPEREMRMRQIESF